MAATDLGQDRLGRFGRYWLGLADAAGGIPPRTALNPAAIGDLAPNLIIVEHLGDGDFLYRLLGTAVDRFTKRRYTGLRTSEIDGHGPGNQIHALYMTTLECGALTGCTLPYVGTNTVCRSVRQIAAPMRGDDGHLQIVSLIEFDLVAGAELSDAAPRSRTAL